MKNNNKNKKPTPTPLPEGDEHMLNLSEQEIKQAFDSLLKQKYSNQEQKRVENFKDLDRILKEYMECCIIMGYDIHGNGVVRMLQQNNLQHDALNNLLHKVVCSQLGGGPFGGINGGSHID
tara:strand:+ start:255 stop:617 length:363 start_codon:yes stop_codon:yes gene_type:complete